MLGMQTLIILFVFFLGAIIASFLSVVADRWGSASWVNGRSRCDHCAKHLRWFELIPLISYIAMRGRCMRCASAVSSAYIIGETIAGVGAVLLVYAFAATPAVLFCATIFFCLMYVVSRYDARHMMVLHELLIPAGVFALLTHVALQALDAPLMVAWSLVSIQILLNGVFIIAPFWLVWRLSKGTKIGLGDIYVFIPLALLVSFQSFVALLLIASVLALVVASFKSMVYRKHMTRTTQVPLVPYLTIAALLVMTLQFDILGIVSRFI